MPRHKVFCKSKSLPKVRGCLTLKEFEDTYGQKCCVQESSCVMKCLWLGVDKHRMQLNERMVKELIEDLQSWLDNAI